MKPQPAGPILHDHVALIEVADHLTLDMLMADERLRGLILRRLSDRVAVIGPGQVDLVLARLRKLGHTPKILEE